MTAAGHRAAQEAVDEDAAEDRAGCRRAVGAGLLGLLPADHIALRGHQRLIGQRARPSCGIGGRERVTGGRRLGACEQPLGLGQPGACGGLHGAAPCRDEIVGRGDLCLCGFDGGRDHLGAASAFGGGRTGRVERVVELGVGVHQCGEHAERIGVEVVARGRHRLLGGRHRGRQAGPAVGGQARRLGQLALHLGDERGHPRMRGGDVVVGVVDGVE